MEGEGRMQTFGAGAEAVRSPQPRSVALRPYRRTSVLDSLQPSQNGMGSVDHQREMYGVKGSASGESEETFDKSLWIRADKEAAHREKESHGTQ